MNRTPTAAHGAQQERVCEGPSGYIGTVGLFWTFQGTQCIGVGRMDGRVLGVQARETMSTDSTGLRPAKIPELQRLLGVSALSGSVMSQSRQRPRAGTPRFP